jgi:3',5'-cyclic AMP phosphodiesterase CpdA
MLTILHGSDLQSGRPYRPGAAAAFARLAGELSPDVIVISGDLTQRAKAREFRTVRGLLSELPRVPVVVTPGNHDVPLFRFWERLLNPYRNWRRFVAPDLDTVTSVPGATLVALNTSAPRRAIVNGRVDAAQVALARRTFEQSPAGHARILVLHHHVVPVPGRVGGSPLPGADGLLRAFEEMGADLVLGGHVHQTRVTWSSEAPVGGHARIPVVSSGTTTSGRGRGVELGRNSLNVVRIDEGMVEVTPYLLEDGATRFEPNQPVRFPRGVDRARFPAPVGEELA